MPSLGVSKRTIFTRAAAAGRWGRALGVVGFFLLYEVGAHATQQPIAHHSLGTRCYHLKLAKSTPSLCRIQDLPQLILQTQYGNFPGWWGVLEAATGGTLPRSDAEFEGTRYGGAYEAKAAATDEE